jgi:UDP-N-acetylmuramate dehydrogenase
LKLLKYLSKNKIKYYILGGGSNIILPDKPFSGVLINLSLLNKIEINNNLVSAESGVALGALAKKCIEKGLSGLEYVSLIPGTLGGALYGNAGLKERTVYDNVVGIDVIRKHKLVHIDKKDLKYEYRWSMFKDSSDIIVKAYFEMDSAEISDMNDIVKQNRIRRMDTQPLEFKNAGSVFKNPAMDSAGRLIDIAGLKGYRINDAEVSQKHANFIINRGNATSDDIKKLIKHIQKVIKDKYNIELELEQVIVDWD